jgi:hypothetical protein
MRQSAKLTLTVTRVSIALALLAALAGCTSVFSPVAMREADTRAQAAYADCDAQLRSGRLKSHRQAVDCAKPKVLAAYQEDGYPFMDLVDLDLRARAAGAARIDGGLASEADIDHDITELDRRIALERQRRIDQGNARGGAPTPVPPEQLLAGLDALTGRALPRPDAACFKVGSFTHCD